MWGWIFVRENSESVLECLRAKFENRRWLQSDKFIIRVSLQDQNSVPNSDSDMFYGLNDRN